MVDGRRGLRQTWPAALVAGVTFALGQFATSNYVSVELTDIVASLVSAAAVVGFLQIWHPSGTPAVATHGPRPAGPGGGRPAIAGGATYDPVFEREARRRSDDARDTPGDIVVAYMPYLIIIAVFALAQISWLPFKDFLANRSAEFNWPGLDILNAKGEAPLSQTFKFQWASAAGTLLLLAGLLLMPLLRMGIGRAARIWLKTVFDLRWAIVTVTAVLALAYVMNLSGETITIGQWLAGAGGIFAFLSAMLGWFGVAVTGSDTSSNALFGALQVSAAHKADLSPTLMAAANSSGGVLGKMISPQNLAIGAAAVGLAGREGDLFRRVVGWSIVLMVLMCVIVYLQSTSLLSWMVP
jgi:lactate permease